MTEKQPDPKIEAFDRHPRKRCRVLDSVMSYVDLGDGRPIVFLHGNPTSSYLWRNVIPHVADLGRCLAPDMIGMGESGRSPLYDYRYVNQAAYLDAWFDAADVGDNAVLVVHDWGSALGFDRAARFPESVAGVCYMEAVVRTRAWAEFGPIEPMFRSLKSDGPMGEEYCLENNLFVENTIPEMVMRKMGDVEMARYRAPYPTRESRIPTLVWPREVPILDDGQPADVCEIVARYSEWMSTNDMPKLFVKAEPGTILREGSEVKFCRGWRNQTEVQVRGLHFLQEDSPHEIGQALREFIVGLPAT
ncbi:haloalkane dehalogenase (plasmid) [Polymorphobacter sp. PAMC 29334]|uniref:haloalkane dehalogenase n=1 Tax=Polymorphobacter sp. PAMC 29334 TaxID=2862331 RepID=UPI001C75002D|nr:haloalkane dehalogenase [Polymorphobacter sp. PAMC 29334]QYE37128.1 haloalkane dehalogenase [Polymorphobacter sp. PAMC 29334]